MSGLIADENFIRTQIIDILRKRPVSESKIVSIIASVPRNIIDMYIVRLISEDKVKANFDGTLELHNGYS